MSYQKKTVSCFSTELNFIKAFIAAVTEADDRIICPTENLDSQFDSGDNQPEFELTIDNCCTLRFVRSSTLATGENYYQVTDNLNRTGPVFLIYQSSTSQADAATLRTWRFKVVANDGILRLDLGSYDADMKNPDLSVVTVACREAHGSAVSCRNNNTAKTPPAINEAFTMTDSSVIKKADRLPYHYDMEDPSMLEIIKNKVFTVPENEERVFTAETLYDSSLIASDSILSLSGKTYYSLDGHTIMEV